MSDEHVSFTFYTKLMNKIAGWLVVNNKKFNKRQGYGYFNRTADLGTIEKIAGDRYKNNKVEADSLIAEYTECAIHDNNDLSFLPNYVVGDNGVKYFKQTYVNMANRVSAYEVLNNRSPAIVYLSRDDTTSANKNVLLDEAKKLFGDFKTCTGWLQKIAGRGYSFYYNDVYNNRDTLQRIYNRKGVNCTDSVELTYNILLGLGYTVQVIHVKCRSGTGHVRLRVKHAVYTAGDWEYYDPASVLNGEGVYSNWCMNGTVLAYDPAWIMNTIKR